MLSVTGRHKQNAQETCRIKPANIKSAECFSRSLCLPPSQHQGEMKYVSSYLIYYTIKLIGIISTVFDRTILPFFESLCASVFFGIVFSADAENDEHGTQNTSITNASQRLVIQNVTAVVLGGTDRHRH